MPTRWCSRSTLRHSPVCLASSGGTCSAAPASPAGTAERGGSILVCSSRPAEESPQLRHFPRGWRRIILHALVGSLSASLFGLVYGETGGSALELHLYGARARRAAAEADDPVLERVRSLVSRVWPELTGREVFAHVLRNAATHSAFSPGNTAQLPTVSTRIPRLMLAGDFVRAPHAALYLERATMTGLEAARQVTAELGLDSAALPTPLAPHPAARSMRALKPLTRLAVRLLPPLSARD